MLCLKSFTPSAAGMDVHKSFVVACIATTNDHEVTNYKSKRFSTFTGDLRRCADWLSENNCKDVHARIHREVLDSHLQYFGTHLQYRPRSPQICESHSGKENRQADAKWIADIFKHDLVSGSFIPPADITPASGLVRYHWKLTNFNVGEKNRRSELPVLFPTLNWTTYFRMSLEKLASAITTRLLESNEPFDVKPYLTKNIKKPIEQIQAAVDGEMCAEQAEKLRSIRSHMDSLELCKLNLESLILSTAEKYTSSTQPCYDGAGYPIFCRYRHYL
ncbi:MAG: hypothetical protein ACLVEX_07535 [Ruthenibacterium lactatiformans]